MPNPTRSRKIVSKHAAQTHTQRLGETLSDAGQRLGAVAQAQGERLKHAGRTGRELVRQHPKSSVGTAVLVGLAVGAGLYFWRKRR